MRDPDRLDNFYDELCKIYKKYVPDWRFGQMMINIFGGENIFYLEEDEIVERVRKYFGE